AGSPQPGGGLLPVLADARRPPLRRDSFDVVVTHFVLDQWCGGELETVVAALAAALRPGGLWIDSDFALPASGPGRRRAVLWLPLLYLFFRRFASIAADRLEDPASLLAGQGLRLEVERLRLGGFVLSRLWRAVE
ncbi:MAG: methyltransferase domain-containing protein, partial [Acidobacteria bacterium]